MTSFTYFDKITFLSSLNAMVSFAVSAKPLISSISPSPKSLCITLSPMENFAIYLTNCTSSIHTPMTIHFNHFIKKIRWSSIISFGKCYYIVPVFFGSSKREMLVFLHIIIYTGTTECSKNILLHNMVYLFIL